MLIGDITIEESSGMITEVSFDVRSFPVETKGMPAQPVTFPLMNPGVIGNLRASVFGGYWKHPITGKEDDSAWRVFLHNGRCIGMNPTFAPGGVPVVRLTFQNEAYMMARIVRSYVQYPTPLADREQNISKRRTVDTVFKDLEQLYDLHSVDVPDYAYKNPGEDLVLADLLKSIFDYYGFVLRFSNAAGSTAEERLNNVKFWFGKKNNPEPNRVVVQKNMTDWAFVSELGQMYNFAVYLDNNPRDLANSNGKPTFVVEDYIYKNNDLPQFFKKNNVVFFNLAQGDLYIERPISSIKSLRKGSDPELESLLGKDFLEGWLVEEDALGFALLSSPSLQVTANTNAPRGVTYTEMVTGSDVDVTNMTKSQYEVLSSLQFMEDKFVKTTVDPETKKEVQTLTPEGKAFMKKVESVGLSNMTFEDVKKFWIYKSASFSKLSGEPFQVYPWLNWSLSFETIGNPWAWIGFQYPIFGISPYYSTLWFLRSMTHTLGNSYRTSYQFYR
jgi:hypothetical protein